MKLHVVLRTHDKKNVHDDWRIRYCDFDKPKIVKGCVTSLVKSLNNVTGWDKKLTILDDHSSKKTITFLESLCEENSFIELVRLEEKGYRNSGYLQYQHCADSDADIVYSVEDDYLHCPNAIQEMLDSFVIFKNNIQMDIVVYPFDAPEIYNPPSGFSVVVHGSKRHWRTGYFTTMVLMTTPKFIKENFQVFGTLAANYDGNYIRKMKENEFRYHESNTIWNLWTKDNKAVRFNPIPSLALHMQFDAQLDPFIDWQKWWNDYT